MKRNWMVRVLCAGVALAMVVLVSATTAAAAAAPPWKATTWTPSSVTPGGAYIMIITVLNTGDQALDGLLTLRTTFPSGIVASDWKNYSGNMGDPQCQIVGQQSECTIDVTGVRPGVLMGVRVNTMVDPGASGALTPGRIELSGAGADPFTEVFSLVAGPIGPFGIRDFEVGMSPALSGLSPTRAGIDPMELTTQVTMRSEPKADFDLPFPESHRLAPTENLRDVVVHVPPGFVGNPTATGVRCSASQLTTATLDEDNLPTTNIPACPPESQVGLAAISGELTPVFNVEPPPGSPAAFGFFYHSVVVTMRARVRPSDHGIDIVAEKAVTSVPIPQFEVTLWGVPSDPSHDALRHVCLHGYFGYNAQMGDCALKTRSDVPFFRTPTSCPGTPLVWGIEMNTYQNVDRFVHNQTTTPATVGCEFNPFDPSFALAPSTNAPRTPSGVEATVSMPQAVSSTGIAQADVKRVTVTLPEGMTINPSSADGLQACTDAQLRLRQEGPASCPDASKLGTVSVRTQLLDHEIGGTVFLRSQASDDPASGELFRIAVEIRSDEDGIAIRLPGSIHVDPVTGRLTTVFDSLPQLPFESMTLRFKTGPRAPLATPDSCGAHATEVKLVSWGERVVDSSSSFDTTGCKAPRFEPTLQAGIENPAAAQSSPLRVRLTRGDDDGHFASVAIDTPKGLLGRIKDVDPCPDAAADAGTCSAASLIGHATVGAGVGPNPFFLDTGRVYLTGPYKGGPYGLAVVSDAIAGPFDLGRVVVRSAIHVDRQTAQLKVVSDRFPTILKGVPLHVRSVRVAIDKPGFIVAPTSCAKKQFGGLATSTDGATARLESRFQIGDCQALRFTPRLGLRLTGRNQTKTGKHPGVKAVVRQAKGQANIARAKVTLPRSLALDPDNAGGLCEFEDGTKPDLENHCPASSIVGRAKAKTPLLDKPLAGDVYFVKNIKRNSRGNQIRTLPMLIVALRGEIAINLKGTSSTTRDGRLINTFNNIPDAPVTKFNLNITGGKQGILTVTATTQGRLNLCTNRQTAQVKMAGQNGKRAAFPVRVKTPCASKKRRR